MKKRLFWTTVIVLISSTVLYFLFLRKSSLESIYYITQIFTTAILIVTIVVSFLQYNETVKANKSNEDFKSIEKAVELADYYRKNILYNAGFVFRLFETVNLTDILLKDHKYELFNQTELNDSFSKKEQDKIKEIVTSEEYKNEAISLYCTYECKATGCERNSIDEHAFQHIVRSTITDTLNCLEYFAMNFSHGIADESVVFESIAPSYIRLVRLLYYEIAKINDPGTSDKYFTNVTKLYIEWANKKVESKEKIKEVYMTNTHHGKTYK